MKRYVITSYIPNSKVDDAFIRTLIAYCKRTDAKLLISQTQPNYREDIENDRSNFLSSLKSNNPGLVNIVKENQSLNDNIMISQVKVNVNLTDPVSGLEGIAARQGSLIIPYPRQRAKMVPRMLKENRAPRGIWCTGTVSEPYYKDTKSGSRMAEFHLKGALIVEILNKSYFNVRQLQWDEQSKGFYDLTTFYSGAKKVVEVIKNVPIEALSLGDDHAVFLNRKIVEKTKQLIKQLSPKKIYHHDTLDCASISHHVQYKHITKALINMTLTEEIKVTSDYLKEMIASSKAEHYLVASNHVEHLDKYLEEARYVNDTFNHIIGLELALAKAKGHNPLEWALNRIHKLERFNVMTRKDTMKVCGYEMLCHGDYGSNGSRGNAKDVGLVYAGKVVTGHSHSPEISVYNNPVNGTMTDLNLPYTNDSAGSKWFWTHTIIYKNGTFSQIALLPDDIYKDKQE